MRSFRIFVVIGTIILSSLACSIPGLGNDNQPEIAQITPVLATEVTPPEPATVEPQPTEAPTLEPSPAPVDDKTCTEIPNFQLCVSKDLASALVASKIPAVDPNSQEVPFWDVMPEHHVIDLQGYALTNTFLKPRIHIIPAPDYFMMTEGALMTGNQLMEMMESRETDVSDLPILPMVNAAPVMTARVNYIENAQLHGVEALTQLAQNFAVVNNYSMIYTFQGITNDERYWIGIVLPITQNTLPVDESVVPGGDYQAFIDQYESYRTDVETTLNSASPDSFSPNYATIQDVINSITYIP